MLCLETNSTSLPLQRFRGLPYMYRLACDTVNYDKTADSVLTRVYIAMCIFPV